MENFFVVSDFMVHELGLRGNDLLAYALIHTCTQDGDGSWHGGYDKLADRIGVSRRNTIKTIQRLIDKGVLEVSEVIRNGVKCNAFSTKRSDETSPRVVMKHHQEGCQIITKGSDETSPNNKYNNKEDNKVIRESVRETPRTLAEFVRMTDSEYAKLVTLMGEQRVAQYIEDLNNWKGSTGKQKKSDYFTIRTWYNKDKKEISSSTPAATSSSYSIKEKLAQRNKI